MAIQFSANFSLSSTVIKNYKIQLRKENERFIKEITDIFLINRTTYELANFANLFLISLDIARPGSVRVRDAICLQKNNFFEFIEAPFNFSDEYLFENQRLKWPGTQELSLGKVWDWASTKNGFLHNQAETNVERALNIFCHAHSRGLSRDIMAQLLWFLAGLESLFVSGQTGIGGQLKEKSFLFLGRPKSHKQITKKINDMYKFRSLLVHGKYGLANPYDELPDLFPYEWKQFRTTSLAYTMLVSSLQKCANQDRNNLNFFYQIED